MTSVDGAGMVAVGEVFAGRYRIEEVLGSGGMGYVLGATHAHLGERVAIKFLRPELAHRPDHVQRFLREARAAVKIRGEHVVRVLDVAEHEGMPYLVMERLEGSDLREVLRVRGTVTVVEAVDWILQGSEAVAAAHALGIVHRDLTPANLFLAGDVVKVLDFGIAKIVSENLALTQSAAMLGSPLYMSPEQLTSSDGVDERSDIWSLGVILFELVAGEPPFAARTLAELGALVLASPAPWLLNLRPEVPAGFASVVATSLRRDASKRFANVADFADALAPFGTEAARASAQRIVALLGLPGERAKVWGQSEPDRVVPREEPRGWSGRSLAIAAPIVVMTIAAIAKWGRTPPPPPVREETVASRPPSELAIPAVSGGEPRVELAALPSASAPAPAVAAAVKPVMAEPIRRAPAPSASTPPAVHTASPAVDIATDPKD